MVCLVTGGAGFIGRHVVQQLQGRGETVRILDPHRWADAPSDVQTVTGSVTDREQVAAAMRDVHKVFHIAGIPHLWQRDKADFYRVNVDGTANVLEAAARAEVERVVFTSSVTTLVGSGSSLRPTAIDETTNLAPEAMLGDYPRSKLLAERLALKWAAKGLPVVVVIPTIPLGPGDVNLTPLSRMILDFLNGKTSALLDFVLNVIDVRDLADGHVRAGEFGRIGERYILGGRNLRLQRLLVLVEQLTGLPMPTRRVPFLLALAAAGATELAADQLTRRPPVAPLTGVRLARFPLLFDSRKAQRELGLHRTPPRKSLAEAITWFFEAGLILRPMPSGLLQSALAP